jgi:hypothetical protein
VRELNEQRSEVKVQIDGHENRRFVPSQTFCVQVLLQKFLAMLQDRIRLYIFFMYSVLSYVK